MKKFISIVFLLISLHSFSQCSDEPFPTINLSLSTKPSFVFEIGAWGTDANRFGGFGGFEVSNLPVTNNNEKTKTLYLESMFFTKGQYRINRYVHITGMVGIVDFEKLVTGFGLRSSIPLSGGLIAILIEPMYRTDGVRINGGVGISLDRMTRPIE